MSKANSKTATAVADEVSFVIKFKGANKEYDLGDLTVDSKHAGPHQFFKNYLAKELVSLNPPYQREPIWQPDQERAFIASLFRPGAELHPITLGIDPDNPKRYMVIDGRQRCETIKKFFSNILKVRLKVIVNGIASYRYVKWKEIQTEEILTDLLRDLDSKQIPLVIYETNEIEQQELIFRMLNNGEGFSPEERAYCPTFLARKVFDSLFREVFGATVDCMKATYRNEERFRHVKATHDLLYHCRGTRLDEKTMPRTTKTLGASAEILHSFLREKNFNYDQEVTNDMLEAIFPGLPADVKLLRKIADWLAPALQTDAPASPTALDPRNVIDPMVFIFYSLRKRQINWDRLNAMRDKDASAWMKSYWESKAMRNYKQQTNDTATMIDKFLLLAETFYGATSKEAVPGALTQDVESWRNVVRGRRGSR